ncbi:MAG: HDIG domain-containing protein [Bacteroidales bacterium]
MARIIQWLQQNLSLIQKIFLFLLGIFLIVQLFPKQPRLGLEYQPGRPWTMDDLIAPFDFAILKSTEEINRERELALQEFQPFYELDESVSVRQKARFQDTFQMRVDSLFPQGMPDRQREINLNAGMNLLDSLFSRGVIFLDEAHQGQSGDFSIRLVDRRVATEKELKDFFSIPEAYLFVNTRLENRRDVDEDLLRPLLENALVHNVFYDQEMSERYREALLENIPLTRGMVQQGEKIISQGELINPEKYQILESFRAEHEKLTGRTAVKNLLYLGQFLLVSISMIVLVLFLYVFRKDVFEDNRRVLLVLLTILLMVFLTSWVIKYDLAFLYLVPVCIVPIVVRAFFDNRLALYVHIITIILIGFLIPRSFEFVFLQFVAGIIAILSMAGLRRRSQLFFTVILIFVTYSAVFTGLSLAHTGTFENLQWVDFTYLLAAAMLTLFAYPLIFMFERLFGLPTDFSLLELADTNNDLLRQLGMMAPGTFQHSLQVANLAEEAIFAIGGNSLLTRTGALYHDIGKMNDPLFFTENQSTGFNPHDEISYEDSARIIIDHVIHGIEKARKKNLPEYIIDFIRTHHGTTTARYFYTRQVQESPPQEVDKQLFTYPGPPPFSKETAVVMMADAVEAASRSLGKPNEKRIDELVEKMIDTQINEKQFDNANITFRDITTIKKVFKRRLMNIYHVRITYPVLNGPVAG